MHRRDWAGTVLVACLIGAADLLRDHTLLLITLLVMGSVCVVVILWDVQRSKGATMNDDNKHAGVNQSVTSHHQSGGITAGTVNIAAPQPDLRIEKVSENEALNDGQGRNFATRVLLILDAPYAAQHLRVEAFGTAISGFELNIAPKNGISAGMLHNPKRPEPTPTHAFAQISAPLISEYMATIYTTKPDAISLRVNLIA